MIFDSAILAALSAELQPLIGSRLRDLWLSQPNGQGGGEGESRALYLAFAGATVVIDTHPQRARLHLTENTPHASVTPTPFIEAARKSLRGARLTALFQPNFDRTLRLSFSARNPIGDVENFTLVAELMERRSNIILLDSEDVIVDALKRLPPFLNRVRTVLPHRPYIAPPGDKANPLVVEDWTAFFAAMPSEKRNSAKDVASELRKNFTGISPLVARALENSLAAGEGPAAAAAGLFDRVRRAAAGDSVPALCSDQPYPFAIGPECEAAEGTLSELIEAQLESTQEAQGIESERASLLAHLARREKKLAAQCDDVEKALLHFADAESFKKQGQMLLANLGAVEAAAKQGQQYVELRDEWSGSGEVLRIAIEPKWPAADNATRCFNRYKRAQKLVADAPRRRVELDEEAATLALLRQKLENAGSSAELERLGRDAGLVVATRKILSRTKEQQESARPENKLRRSEVDGWTLYMGRSAIENQLLLSKVARPSDVWMHVRGMPSAHVLIKAQKGKEPPPKVLEEAGRWVATAGRSGSKTSGELVEIIYTQAKWVRAVKGSPGKVTLQRFQTLNVRA